MIEGIERGGGRGGLFIFKTLLLVFTWLRWLRAQYQDDISQQLKPSKQQSLKKQTWEDINFQTDKPKNTLKRQNLRRKIPRKRPTSEDTQNFKRQTLEDANFVKRQTPKSEDTILGRYKYCKLQKLNKTNFVKRQTSEITKPLKSQKYK